MKSSELIALPRLLLIADGFATGRRGRDVGGLWMTVESIVHEASVAFVMLRDHEATEHEFSVAAAMVADTLDPFRPRRRPYLKRERMERLVARYYGREGEGRPSVYIVANSRPAAALESRTGLHVGTRGPALAEVKGRFPLLGFSAHTPDEAGRAAREGADYITFSPIFPTSSKPGHGGVGLDALAEAARAASPIPVYALGGVTPGRVRACLETGAQGVAVISGILDAPDPVAAALDYHTAIASRV